MHFERSLNRLMFGLVAAFMVVLAAALYWGVLASDSALASPFNYRQRAALASVERGLIADRENQTLAESLPNPDGTWRRTVYSPALHSILGYFSLTYGTGGAEAAYNALLGGTDQPETFTSVFDRDVLHRPQRGSAVRLTLDFDIQQAASDLLAERVGAVVVMDANTGALLAVASSPTVDPATLDAEWEALIERPDNPFFNRALQGEYQPGGALQPILLAGWLIAGGRPDSPLELADGLAAPVSVNGVTVGCAVPPGDAPETLQTGFTYGCPAAFNALISTQGEAWVQELLTLFGATRHVELAGFTLPPTAAEDVTAARDWRTDALGQGDLRLSPLDMAVMVAALANAGNAPLPYLLDATRPPGQAEWVSVVAAPQTQPITTSQTAQAVQALMVQAVAQGGTASAAAQDGLTLGAHVGLAESGEAGLAWFTGFVQLEPGRNVVAVVLFEAETDPSVIAQAGGDLLAAAHGSLSR